MASYPLQNVPGNSTYRITVYEEGDSQAQGLKGFTLAELRQRLGGDEVEVRHPVTGEMVHVTLSSYSASDNSKKRYLVMYDFMPMKPIAKQHHDKVAAFVSDRTRGRQADPPFPKNRSNG